MLKEIRFKLSGLKCVLFYIRPPYSNLVGSYIILVQVIFP